MHPGLMSVDYSTKIISNMIKAPKKLKRTPKCQIKPKLMRTQVGNANLSMRVYAIEVKTQYSRDLMTILK
jgi:hypothetical protein